MRIWRTQDNVPEVYIEGSRDFQLIGRAYDSIINGVKYDADTLINLINTNEIKVDILPLLQEKLGFFSNKSFDSSELRSILEVFPLLVKNKGSLLAVREAINVFLKVKGIKSSVIASYSDKERTENGRTFRDHTIVVGIDSPVVDITILKEIFRYILPTGYEAFFYFYSDIYKELTMLLENKSVKLVLYKDASPDDRELASQVRSASTSEFTGKSYNVDDVDVATEEDYIRLVGATDTTLVYSKNRYDEENMVVSLSRGVVQPEVVENKEEIAPTKKRTRRKAKKSKETQE